MTQQPNTPATSGIPTFGQWFRGNHYVAFVVIATFLCAALAFGGFVRARTAHGFDQPSLLWFIPTLAVFALLEVGLFRWQYRLAMKRRLRAK